MKDIDAACARPLTAAESADCVSGVTPASAPAPSSETEEGNRTEEARASLMVPGLCRLAAFSAVLIAGKELMNPLPNIHPAALLLMLCTRLYGWQALYVAAVFIVSQALLHGFGLWFLSYLYLWPLWVVFCMLLRENGRLLFWALASGIFGLLFGAFCALPYLFVGGTGTAGGSAAAISYWITGIPFDLLHGAGNFVLTLVAMKPLERLLLRLQR